LPVFNALTDKFTPFDAKKHFRKFKGSDVSKLLPGVYKLNIRPKICGTVPLVGDCFDSTTIDSLLKFGLVKLENIKWAMPANSCAPADLFKAFEKKIRELLDKNESKDVINMTIGTWAGLHEKSFELFVTTDIRDLGWFMEKETLAGREPDFIEVCGVRSASGNEMTGGMFICRREIKTPRQHGHFPIYQRIVEATSMMMHETWLKAATEKSQCVAIRTDCITLTHPKKL
jgi:hypothetical protein